MTHKLLIVVAIALVSWGIVSLDFPAAGSATSDTGWWDAQWPYRATITVNAAGYERTDHPAEVEINFTDLLAQLGQTGRLNLDSLRVVEMQAGQVTDDAVPYQFDRGPGFDAQSNAGGTLVILMTGVTPATASRVYQVYFDVAGIDYEDPKFPNLVALSTITDTYGYETYRLNTPAGVYHYHKAGGGFASLFDTENNDWIAWNPAPRGAGDFRGVPNMVHPNDGGYFHPGRTGVESVAVRRGPLKVTIRSTTPDGAWATRWELFPAFARVTVEKVPDGIAYWLLYEGTPGGQLDLSTDLLTRSDGTTTTAGESWSGDLVGEEWVYFTDPTLDRSLFVVHHEEDEIVDSYAPGTERLMTILGFGRSGTGRFLTAVPQQMTFGLAEGSGFEIVQRAIHNAYKPLEVSLGLAEERSATPTPSPSPTPLETEKPAPTATPTETATPVPTETPTASATPLPTNTATATPSATATALATATPSPTATVSSTATPSPTASPTTVPGTVHTIYLGIIVGP